MNKLHIKTEINVAGEDTSWEGTCSVEIATVVDGELGVERFNSDPIKSENPVDLLDFLTTDLERLVNLSNLLDDVNFDGADDLSAA